jgi:glutaredoxin
MPASIQATLVTSEACHFCEDAQELLTEMSREHPISVRLVDMLSDEGRQLAVAHRMPFPPLLLLNGEAFGHGRISRRKLTKHLNTTLSTPGGK